MDFIIDIIALVISTAVGLIVGSMYKSMKDFFGEQREVNKANALANRSMQRDVLFRYFRIVVEQGNPITPEEYEHIERCYTAYHKNGGNGTGTLMFEKIKQHAIIDTGRS